MKTIDDKTSGKGTTGGDGNKFPQEHTISGMCTLCKLWELKFIVKNDKDLNLLRKWYKDSKEQVKNGATHEEIDKSKVGCKGHQSNLTSTLDRLKKDKIGDKINDIKKEQKEDPTALKFDQLFYRDIIGYTRSFLEECLIIKPSRGFKIKISGVILFGPNGTGKTEFCSSLKIDPKFKECCDFVDINVHDLISSKMGESSANVKDIFSKLQDVYQNEGRIQVPIMDEGEMLTLEKDNMSSKAYAELSAAMLRETGKFKGIFCIIITNKPKIMAKGTMSRNAQIFWPGLDNEEKYRFFKGFLLETPIKTDWTNYDKVKPFLNYDHYSDIRELLKLVDRIEGWFVRKYEHNDYEINIEDYISIIDDFNSEILGKKYPRRYSDDETTYFYPSEGDMIDYIIENIPDKYKQDWINFKNKWDQKGCVGNQLEGHLKPTYRKWKNIENIKKQEEKKTTECHQTGFKEDGTKVEREKPVEKEVEKKEEVKVKEGNKIEKDKKVPLVCNKCGEKFSINIDKNKKYNLDLEHVDLIETSGCTGKLIEDDVCEVCKKPSGGNRIIRSKDNKTWVHEDCLDQWTPNV